MSSGTQELTSRKADSGQRTEAIAQCVYVLAEAFRQKTTPVTITAYELGLSSIPIDTIKRAVAVAVRDCRFMPSVQELRGLCGVAIGGIDDRDKPLLAWQAVRDAVRRVGGYASPEFEDKTIHAVIRELGGWVDLCNTSTEDMQWVEKRFMASYATMSRVKLPEDQTKRLTGISEADNVLNGHDQPVGVVDVRCLSVATRMDAPAVPRIESSIAPRIEHGETVREPIKLNLKLPEIPDAEPSPPVTNKSKEEQLAMLRTFKFAMKGETE